jgi:plastocyanin
MTMSRAVRTMVVVVALAGALAACGKSDKKSTAASGGNQVLNVQAGLNDQTDVNIAVLAYLPQSVTVKAGSAVEWRFAGPEPHSVTFVATGTTLPPPGSDQKLFAPTPAANGSYDGKSLVNSGLLPLGPAPADPFRLTFPTAGKFTYQCVIHPQMTGNVTVVGSDGKADTQVDIDKRSGTELNQWLDEGRVAKKKMVDTPPVKTVEGGVTTYKVQMGTSTAHTDVLGFAPVDTALKPGDKVTFVNDSGAPHTASFAGKAGLPQSPVDPAVDKAAPGPSPQTLNANAFFNTGLLPPNAPPGSGPPEVARSFTFVVPAAGTYAYVCLLHSTSGMAGTLKVA